MNEPNVITDIKYRYDAKKPLESTVIGCILAKDSINTLHKIKQLFPNLDISIYHSSAFPKEEDLMYVFCKGKWENGKKKCIQLLKTIENMYHQPGKPIIEAKYKGYEFLRTATLKELRAIKYLSKEE